MQWLYDTTSIFPKVIMINFALDIKRAIQFNLERDEYNRAIRFPIISNESLHGVLDQPYHYHNVDSHNVPGVFEVVHPMHGDHFSKSLNDFFFGIQTVQEI
jgi:hypothetical protein